MRGSLATVALVLAAGSVAAQEPPRQLRKAVASENWRAVLQICAELAEDEARAVGRENRTAAYYASLSVHCAVAARATDNDWLADWWWHTAAYLDSAAAQKVASDLDLGHLTAPPDFRTPAGPPDAADLSNEQVRLLSGEVVKGTAAVAVPGTTKYPKGAMPHLSSVEKAEVRLQVVVATDGHPTQPVLLSARALPIHAFLVFTVTRNYRFEPAFVAGERVESAFTLTTSFAKTKL